MTSSPTREGETRRIGVFGGTFDPVHLAHLILAEQCREQGRLDQVWFVPSARPPHKQDHPRTPFAQRAEMLALALAGYPAFQINEVEKERPGPSYTADTLEELHRREPGTDFWLIIGSDSLADLPHWHAPDRIVAQAGLLVVARPGWQVLAADQLRAALRLPEGQPPRLHIVSMPLLEIASRDLRQRAHEGRSLRYFVPRAVECYIETHQLYRDERTAH